MAGIPGFDAVPCAPQASRVGSAIAIPPHHQRTTPVAQLGWQKPADGSDTLAIARISWQGHYPARFIRFIRFKFLILIGRFVTLEE